jgi:hypothetical protein
MPETPTAEAWPAPDLMTVPQAARRIGKHPESLYRQCRAGTFPPAVKIAGSWRVSAPRLEAYLRGEITS